MTKDTQMAQIQYGCHSPGLRFATLLLTARKPPYQAQVKATDQTNCSNLEIPKTLEPAHGPFRAHIWGFSGPQIENDHIS